MEIHFPRRRSAPWQLSAGALLVGITALLARPPACPAQEAPAPAAAPAAPADEKESHRFAGPSLPTDTPPARDANEASLGFELNTGGIRIGYLPEGTDFDPARELMPRLAAALEANAALAAAMKEAGHARPEILPRACDSPEDMIQRLGAEEFELAFASSIVYANQFRRRIDAPETLAVRYEPILQFRRENDIHNPRETGVWRKAKVFAGPAASFWGRAPSDEDIRRELETSELAVADFYSAAGHIYPRLEIQNRFGLRPRGIVFCGSGAEAVKHVAAGLVALGACEARVFDELASYRAEGAAPAPLAVELFETPRIPTDPILLRGDLMPRASSLALGRELIAALRAFFNASPQPAPGLWVEDAERRAYEDIARALAQFETGDAAPAAPAPPLAASALPPEPAAAAPQGSAP